MSARLSHKSLWWFSFGHHLPFCRWPVASDSKLHTLYIPLTLFNEWNGLTSAVVAMTTVSGISLCLDQPKSTDCIAAAGGGGRYLSSWARVLPRRNKPIEKYKGGDDNEAIKRLFATNVSTPMTLSAQQWTTFSPLSLSLPTSTSFSLSLRSSFYHLCCSFSLHSLYTLFFCVCTCPAHFRWMIMEPPFTLRPIYSTELTYYSSRTVTKSRRYTHTCLYSMRIEQ